MSGYSSKVNESKNRILNSFNIPVFLTTFFLISSQDSLAANYYWVGEAHSKSPTPQEACEKSLLSYHTGTHRGPVVAVAYTQYKFLCTGVRKSNSMVDWFVVADRYGDSCSNNSAYNPSNGSCEPDEERKERGRPDSVLSCPSTKVLNPVNVGTGNKFQEEVDIAELAPSDIGLTRYYNGQNGLWTNTYSLRLAYSPTAVSLTRSDGRVSTFKLSGSLYLPEGTEFGSLVRSADKKWWLYTSSNNELSKFNESGDLVSLSRLGRPTLSFSYSGSANSIVNIVGGFGGSLRLLKDSRGRLVEAKRPGLIIAYYYGENSLTKVTYNKDGQISTRQYHYEDTRAPSLLTGITDERGARYATWSYDDKGRAISSEHAGGAEKGRLTYNVDGSTTVVNEFGKSTTYRFETIQGIKRITSIEGEPTANCPASNSTFTYSDRGQVLTRTDAKGFITTYTYNDRGLETSRTEATGTPQARTTTTTWHATFNLPLTVTEGSQVTTYTYDAQGRQTSRTQTAL